ncbi:MAG: response regulator transcription factor [Lachnospiraceae bacterium]|nr:response regulator transcription factor [Lachnospiraceae bacterium]MCI9646262.1 response regulator transcription factor [Lachnospiraceae bacterium]
MAHILLVEDDKGIVENLTEFLQKEGFTITSVDGQEKALALLETSASDYDLMLLDVSLAEGNGFAVCRAVKANTSLPVIFLTASGDEYSVVTGLDLGADDYIAKPFRPRELVSRIHNILRRYGKANALLEYKGLSVDMGKGTVAKDGREILLSALEYRLLLYFMNHKGMILSRSRLLDALWDIAGEFVNDNTLTVYIKRLREKIEDDPQNPALIKTVRGMGYRMGE